ncbi:hypothetical protein AHAS_Ahas13G0179300 [Arachis hypogaea]
MQTMKLPLSICGKIEKIYQHFIWGEDRLDDRICDYVRGSNWDLNHILELLDKDWAPIFAVTEPLEASFGDDQVAWLHSANGSFSIKLAYSIYLEIPEDSTASLFLKVWKLNALQRIRAFCWLLFG